MISAVAWIPKGVAKSKPDRTVLTAEELEELKNQVREQRCGRGRASGDGNMIWGVHNCMAEMIFADCLCNMCVSPSTREDIQDLVDVQASALQAHPCHR